MDSVIENRNIRRDTPIHLAAYAGNVEVVKFLAPLVENCNAPNKSGDTPIQWAAEDGHQDVVDILTQYAHAGNNVQQ